MTSIIHCILTTLTICIILMNCQSYFSQYLCTPIYIQLKQINNLDKISYCQTLQVISWYGADAMGSIAQNSRSLRILVIIGLYCWNIIIYVIWFKCCEFMLYHINEKNINNKLQVWNLLQCFCTFEDFITPEFILDFFYRLLLLLCFI